MFWKRCRLLIKRIYNSFAMFNQENIAAAQIAQIFGSELLKVQQSARTDGGSVPDIVRLDPKQILVGQSQSTAARQSAEQRIIQALQREAEAAYPVAQAESYMQQAQPATLPPQPVSSAATEVRQEHWSNKTGSDFFLEKIANSLERIANAVDKVEIKPKRKTIKRNKSKFIKPTLLNETTT